MHIFHRWKGNFGRPNEFFSGTKDLGVLIMEEMVPTIDFMDANLLPTVSTCGLTITFPRSFAQVSFDEFRSKMDLCILESQGFGNA